MTPPPAAALLDAAVPGTAVLPAPGPGTTGAAVRRRRRRPVTLVRPDWSCDNCETPNAGRRRRCADCGTSRV